MVLTVDLAARTSFQPKSQTIILTGALLLVLSSLFWAQMVKAEESSFWDKYKDPKDGKFDIIGSRELTTGFLPLIIPFNEPAVGFGAVGALAYFHPKEEDQTNADGQLSSIPPSISFGGGLYSENETWAVAGGHMGVWNQGRLRYLGALVYGSANLDFYGIGPNLDTNREPIPFNIEGGGTIQQLDTRIGESKFIAGARYEYSSSYGTFNTEEEVDDEGRNLNAGLGIYGSYDNRDNIFTPNTGTLAKISVALFDPAFGGDFNYNRFDFRLNQYVKLHPRVRLGIRLEYVKAGHDAPFYALPWVKLRGIPAFRYLGNHVMTSEIEPRWSLSNRWSVLAFAGVGRAARNFDSIKDAERAYNYGGGFRYLIARRLGLTMGLDMARGPEDTTGYLTVGSAW